jgi:tRNA dimethylallyltransferase
VTRHLALVGPTATGKSAVALAIARELGDAEIISLDAMQVYREMDIGTAKPTPAERDSVPHHLVDIADAAEEWSVQRTQVAAHEALQSIEARGRRAIFVGGTGLYVQAVIDAFDVPGSDAQIRAELERATRDAGGLADAYERLALADPDAAARIEPGNRRRVVRALEVIELTGRPFSSFGPGMRRFGMPAVPLRFVGLWMERTRLGARIVDRVSTMDRDGFVAEVERLADRPAGLGRTARQAIGYKEILMHLDGRISRDDALELIVRRTKQFARRQRVWFRRDPRIVWIGTSGNTDHVAKAVLATWCVDSPRVQAEATR